MDPSPGFSNCVHLWIPRSQGREQVVRVHDDVDQRVEEEEEGGVPAGHETHARPDRQRHDTMMDNVQQRHLSLKKHIFFNFAIP